MLPGEIGIFLSRTAPRLLVVVFTIMVLLFVVTGFLTRAYNNEKLTRAEHQYQAGLTLVEEGQYEEAVEMYTEALTLARGKPSYQQYLQALALALVEAGRTGEAETYLLELTTTDPANGIANLMLARIYHTEGDGIRSMQYYQRAIYGLWNEDPRGNRIRVRFELVNVLEQQREYREMEAELLRLLDEAPDEPVMKKRIAHLFMAAQSYDAAAKIFSEVTVRDPEDAEALAGFGDAEFELGNYLSARTAYRKALQYRSDDLQSRTQFDLASEIISLDPMARRLSSGQQLRRSRVLVERSLEGLNYCLPEDLEMLPEAFRETLEAARSVAGGKVRQRQSMENVEQNIALAEQLERYRRLNCGYAPVPDRALELVLAKLAE
jgi:tetratricopeptide (TPR) repeat protein